MAEITKTMPTRLAFVGFGEAAQAFLSGWGKQRPETVTAYDIKSNLVEAQAQLNMKYRAFGVDGASSIGKALEGANAIFCVVTADRAFVAADAASGYLNHAPFWFDCNSCAPDTKRRAATVTENAGGRYVDVAVMAPVYPKQHKVPLLVSGPHAKAASRVLSSLGMCPQIAGPEIGQASTIKMMRSVMIKGMEALYAECFLAARRAGVDKQVLTSLMASNPEIHWPTQGAYNLERMMVHGERRAAEMREVALTVRDLGLPNSMSEATANWQELIAKKGVKVEDDDLQSRLDSLLKYL